MINEVLGAINVKDVSTLNANEVEIGTSVYCLASSGSYQNVPETGVGSTAFLLTMKDAAAYTFQLYVCVVNCGVWVRTKNNESLWWGWNKITFSN